MPANAVATASTVTFFGAHKVPMSALRPPLSVSDVSPDDDGLRLLAAAGRWQAVGALAERLESQRLDPKSMLPTEASLKCTLVRVQAYFRLYQMDKVRVVFELLGNFTDSRFYEQAPGGKRRSIIPFSLLFLHAQYPGLLGQSESQIRLYALQQQCDEASTAGSSITERQSWKSRGRRVTRALIANHFELEQFGPALALQRTLADMETHELHHLLAIQSLGCMCLRSGNSALATEVFRSIERMQMDDDAAMDADTASLLANTKEVVVALNHALLLSFHGYFVEACATLRNILSGLPVTTAAPFAAATATWESLSMSSPTSTTGSTVSQQEIQSSRQQLRRYAAISLCACLPYLHRNDTPDTAPVLVPNPAVSIPVITAPSTPSKKQRAPRDDDSHPLASSSQAPTVPPPFVIPKTTVQSLLASMEEAVRADPAGMVHLDAFLFNYHRLCELENAAAGMPTDVPSSSNANTHPLRQDIMDGLVEQFRGWRRRPHAAS